MKILVLNPNTTQAFTEVIRTTAMQAKSSGTDIICLNPAAGPRSIESDYDELLSVAPWSDVSYTRANDGLTLRQTRKNFSTCLKGKLV
jgi:Asp/Glu/hydantoin racemase